MSLDVPPKLDNRALFIGFFKIGIMGFGGVLAIARRAMVEQWQWLTQAEFNDLFSLCQFMPGANITNFAFAFGARQGGWRGAACAVVGLLTAPIIIVLLMGALFARFATVPAVEHTVGGMAAAAAGLVAATAFKIAQPGLVTLRPACVTALAFALVIVLHVPLLGVLALMLPLSIALAWRA
ncbi:MAG: chromate transporter [Acidocella sp.]|nr:chromate transporter [Acidocella sp.]